MGGLCVCMCAPLYRGVRACCVERERREREKLCGSKMQGRRDGGGVVTVRLTGLGPLFLSFILILNVESCLVFFHPSVSQFSFGCRKCWTAGAAALKERKVAHLSAWKRSSNCTQTQQVSIALLVLFFIRLNSSGKRGSSFLLGGGGGLASISGTTYRLLRVV